jgi:hypothetical protein
MSYIIEKKQCRLYAVSDVEVIARYIGSDFLPAYDHISSPSETGRSFRGITVSAIGNITFLKLFRIVVRLIRSVLATARRERRSDNRFRAI